MKDLCMSVCLCVSVRVCGSIVSIKYFITSILINFSIHFYPSKKP